MAKGGGGTMETWAKLTGAGKMLKGGISGFNKQMKRLQKVKQKKQDKENAKIKKEAADEYVREHKDISKRLRDGALTTQKAQEAYKKAIEDYTAKIQAIKTGPEVKPTPVAKPPLVAGQDNKTGGPNVAGQDISGVDSVAIITAIDKQTAEITTGLGTQSPQSEPEAQETPESVAIITAIDKQTAELTTGLGTQSPQSEKKEETPDADTLDKLAEAGTTKGSIYVHDDVVLEEVKETNVTLAPMKSALSELVDMGRDELAFDARREKREIKEDTRALEDRRDARGARGGGKKGRAGSPILNKRGGGDGDGDGDGDGGGHGWGAVAARWLAPILAPFTALSLFDKFKEKAKIRADARTKAADARAKADAERSAKARADKMAKQAARAKAHEAKLRADAEAKARGKPTLKPDGKGLGKIIGQTKTVLKATTKAVPLLAVAMSAYDVISTESNKNLDRTEKNIAHAKTTGGIAGAAAGFALGAPLAPFTFGLSSLIGASIGYYFGSDIAETAAEEISSKTDISNKSGNVTLSQEDKELLAFKAETMGAVNVGGGHGDITDLKTLSELDTDTLESLLDTETWSKEDEARIFEIIAAKKEGRVVNYVPEDVGSKWNPFDNVAESLSYGEVGSAGSPTVNGAPPTVADEDRALAKRTWTTGNMGTLYFNEAQLEKYKALELATKATRQEAEQIKRAAEAQLKKELTAEGVFSGQAFYMDEDDPRKAEMLAREKKIEEDAEKMIQESKDAKLLFLNQMKRDTETQDKLKQNWIDKRKKKTEATIQPSSGLIPTAGSPTVNGVNVSGSGTETPLDGDKRLTRKESIDAISREMKDATSLEEYDELQRQLFKVKGMTSDEFDKLTPDASIMDRFYVAGTTKGSIYVRDINLERAISTLGIELGKAETLESDWLDKLKVTAGEWAIVAPQNSGQAATMVNAPTTIDQSAIQSVNVGSSAHAPAQPSGSGYMGISGRG